MSLYWTATNSYQRTETFIIITGNWSVSCLINYISVFITVCKLQRVWCVVGDTLSEFFLLCLENIKKREREENFLRPIRLCKLMVKTQTDIFDVWFSFSLECDIEILSSDSIYLIHVWCISSLSFFLRPPPPPPLQMFSRPRMIFTQSLQFFTQCWDKWSFYRVIYRFHLVPPIDGEWGVKKPDGQFTGMIGMLQRNVSMTRFSFYNRSVVSLLSVIVIYNLSDFFCVCPF